MLKRALALVMTALTFAACSGGGATAAPSQGAVETSSAPGKAWTVGVSMPTLQFPFAVALKNAVEARATKLAVKTVVTDANLDVATELSNVEGLINQKVDCLLFVGVQGEASVGAIKAANKAGTPVVEFNGLAQGGDYVSFVGSDQAQAGQQLGQWLVDLQKSEAASGKANLKVLHLSNQPGWVNDIGRNQGFDQTIAGIKGNLTIIDQFGKGDRGTSQTVTESVLQANPDIDAVVANSDDMALGAIAAVDAIGKTGKIHIIGLDGAPEMLAQIKAGKADATVFQDPEAQGAGGLQACVDHLNGKQLEKKILIPFILTTTANLDEIMKISDRVYPKT